MGGEKYSPGAFRFSTRGSPPRGRGKASAGSSAALSFRIPPAWAGKRRPQQRHRMALQDHPRMGGEKILEPSMGVGNFGSPPRGRGKDETFEVVPQDSGITPAWAGKSSGCRYTLTSGWDHPRVGGEKCHRTFLQVRFPGSPPRGRGKDIVVKGHSSREGITPAWAGKRLNCKSLSELVKDHPRVGGEKKLLISRDGLQTGSPPRGRGKGTDFNRAR